MVGMLPACSVLLVHLKQDPHKDGGGTGRRVALPPSLYLFPVARAGVFSLNEFVWETDLDSSHTVVGPVNPNPLVLEFPPP